MYLVFEYFAVLVLVVVVGGFLFLAAALIFLLEEAAKFLVRFLGNSASRAWVWLSSHSKDWHWLRTVFHNAKP